MKRNDIFDKKEEILKWIDENRSKASICRELKCKPETLNSYLNKMGIDYAGNPGLKNVKKAVNYKKASDYIKGISVHSNILKLKLIREGIKEHKCEKCGGTEWLGGPIPIELHHIDGNHYNNDFSNLQILCPNCHAIETNPVRKVDKPEKPKNTCIICGKVIKMSSEYCEDCFHLTTRKVNRPERDELKEKIRNNSFLSLSALYGVSDNAIRKWCIYYNLPNKKAEINKYTNDEWDKL